MKTYLVGGAVRDQLMGLSCKDRDWVVVGAQPDQLLEQGFQPVGKDFPVFLHPQTKEEYALARRERKTGTGYTGFTCEFGTEVSLEDDLLRRDLTINAMAMDEHGTIIDPFKGQADLAAKTLRHVSPAFLEDPLRVLRVARFLARYSHLGFSIHPSTLALMADIAAQGELANLTPERVWQETEKALLEPEPWQYIQALRDSQCLEALFPELDRLFGVPQPPAHHPEIDTGVHVLMTLKAAMPLMEKAQLEPQERVAVLFALLCHDLGKGLTPEHDLPRHHGHEKISEHLCELVCQRWRVPKEVQRLGELMAHYHTHSHRAFELKPATIMRLFESLDAFRRPRTLSLFLLTCEADARGRLGLERRPYEQVAYLTDCAQAARQVDPKPLVALGLKGQALGSELRQRRIQAIRGIKRSYVRDSD